VAGGFHRDSPDAGKVGPGSGNLAVEYDPGLDRPPLRAFQSLAKFHVTLVRRKMNAPLLEEAAHRHLPAVAHEPGVALQHVLGAHEFHRGVQTGLVLIVAGAEP